MGYLRLQKALSQFSSPKVHFTLRLAPYQLYPDFSMSGEDKYAWYKREKYNDSDERMAMYTRYMGALASAEGVAFDFHGPLANTLHAHRVLWWVQETHGPEAAGKALESLYGQYFSQRAHPSASETLERALAAAGVEDEEARKVVGDENEGLVEVKRAIREQAGNGVDSVPWVVVEGRRRDFTLVGAKEVGEYGRVLEQVVKEV